mmetsp:Transcript_76060/g.174214  ORF Transcript_76060/g.174214 Transcript_76060/m.174214 type:complete len:266 (+) Transcript_76060:78-875(+)
MDTVDTLEDFANLGAQLAELQKRMEAVGLRGHQPPLMMTEKLGKYAGNLELLSNLFDVLHRPGSAAAGNTKLESPKSESTCASDRSASPSPSYSPPRERFTKDAVHMSPVTGSNFRKEVSRAKGQVGEVYTRARETPTPAPKFTTRLSLQRVTAWEPERGPRRRPPPLQVEGKVSRVVSVKEGDLANFVLDEEVVSPPVIRSARLAQLAKPRHIRPRSACVPSSSEFTPTSRRQSVSALRSRSASTTPTVRSARQDRERKRRYPM